MTKPRAAALLLPVGLAVWITVDLAAPRHSDLRVFDPVAIARSETAMWRSYYDHRPVAVFSELTALLRSQYHMPFWRSCVTAYHGAKAAAVFQRGHNRGEYELALPDLNAFYNLIRRSSANDFRVQEAARLELEWWIVHRERSQHRPDDLALDLAQLQAEIYQLPVARFLDHARARAEAMLLRDDKSDVGLNSADWAQIEQLLITSWTSLRQQFEAA